MPTRKTIREALTLSIEKYVRAAVTGEIEFGAGACPLCRIFMLRNDHCEGCPVAEAGFHGCEGTPYNAFEQGFPSVRRDKDTIRAISRSEAEFLGIILGKFDGADDNTHRESTT